MQPRNKTLFCRKAAEYTLEMLSAIITCLLQQCPPAMQPRSYPAWSLQTDLDDPKLTPGKNGIVSRELHSYREELGTSDAAHHAIPHEQSIPPKSSSSGSIDVSNESKKRFERIAASTGSSTATNSYDCRYCFSDNSGANWFCTGHSWIFVNQPFPFLVTC